MLTVPATVEDATLDATFFFLALLGWARTLSHDTLEILWLFSITFSRLVFQVTPA